MFIIIVLLLLLGAISAIIVTIKPWMVSDRPMCCSFHVQNSYLTLFVCFFLFPFVFQQIGAAFLLVLLLLVLAIGVIHYWASNNFYLTRIQMLLVCFLAFLLALAAFLVGWFQGRYSSPVLRCSDSLI